MIITMEISEKQRDWIVRAALAEVRAMLEEDAKKNGHNVLPLAEIKKHIDALTRCIALFEETDDEQGDES